MNKSVLKERAICQPQETAGLPTTGYGRRRYWRSWHRAFAATIGIGCIVLLNLLWRLASFPSRVAVQNWLLGQATHHDGYTGNTILASDPDNVNSAVAATQWKCIPPPSTFLLQDESVLSNLAVQAAFKQIELLLTTNGLYNKDAVSVSIVHASKGKVFEHHSGRIRLNESAAQSPAYVDGDSIYRIASISKTFTVLEALVLNRQAQTQNFTPELTLDTRLKSLVPEFDLPDGFEGDSEDITLAQLGSHLAGLARDIGEFEIDSLKDITYPPTSGFDLLKDFPHNRTEEELVQLSSQTDLIWQVGEMPSYSNTGFSLLGIATERYYDRLHGSKKDFRSIVTQDILEPLNMSHSFLGPIPGRLRKNVVTPAARSFVDKVFNVSHDPAGGIFSTSNDLANFIYNILLSEKPSLITPGLRRTWLKSIFQFTDGISSVGVPWETFRAVMPDYSTYNLYSKGGGLPAQYTEISVLPEYGYGVVVLVSLGITDEEIHAGKSFSNPFLLSMQINNILAPALWQAYNSAMKALYVGIYVSGDGFAKLSLKEGMLVLERFLSKGIDVLLQFDRLAWTQTGKQKRVFDVGAKLQPTGLEGQFRAAPLYGCSWGSFDAVKVKSGWGIDKFVLRKGDKNKMELVYEPMGAILYKVG